MDDAAKGDRRPSPSLPARAGARFRVMAVRYRLTRWLAAAAAGLISVMMLTNAQSRAESARAGWGSSVDVIVTTRAMPAGTRLGPSDYTTLAAPLRLVPANALDRPPAGLRLTAGVGPGEILVDERVTTLGGSTAALALPPGSRGIRLPADDVVGETGDAVELHALVSGAFLAEGVIVHRDDGGATVAVPAERIGAVIDAVSAGGIVSVLVP